MPRVGWVAVLSLVVGVAGCTAASERPEPPAPDMCVFERDVYPVLARDCGFPACHGDAARTFRVFAPGRARLDPETPLSSAPTPDELQDAYERARSMLAAASTPDRSLLLRKPLDAAAGGGVHFGVDAFGRDVYASRDDPGWKVLERWAKGQQEEEPCP